MMRRRWLERSVRGLMLFMASVLMGSMGAVMPALAQNTSLITGFVMEVDKAAATLEVERQRGDFTTLYLDKEARWVLKKVDIGDRVHAFVVNQDGRLVVKEISFQIGPAVQMDIVQGIVTRTNPRGHSIEVKTSLGTDEVLYLDQNSLGILARLAAGDQIEARVETIIEEGGARKVIRTILIGKGP